MFICFIRNLSVNPAAHEGLWAAIHVSVVAVITLAALFLIHGKLIERGYDNYRVRLFLVLGAALLYPSAQIGARLFRIFSYPRSYWQYALCAEQFALPAPLAFHDTFIIALLALMVLMRVFRFRLAETLDTVALYIPLCYALGALSCLLVGCGWIGRAVCPDIYTLSINQHLLLWADPLGNLAIFALLLYGYRKIYAEAQSGLEGLIFAGYLLLYGNLTFFLETARVMIPRNSAITQPQIIMLCLVVPGLVVFFTILAKSVVTAKVRDPDRQKPALALLGFTAVFVPFAAVANFLLKHGIVRWPLRDLHDPADALSAVLSYMPILIVALSTLAWLKMADVPVRSLFRRMLFSKFFIAGILLSGAVAFWLMKKIDFSIEGPTIWGWVLFFSVLNSFTEELMFRGSLLGVLKKNLKHPLAANVVQSLFYASMHFYPAGPLLALAALLYGLLLGQIMENSRSLFACIICHFIIDFGIFSLAITAQGGFF